MIHQLSSRKRALYFSTVLFAINLSILIFTNHWWPGIMLAIGLPFSLRQYLLGRSYDTFISLIVFVGTFVTVSYDISWQIFLPVLFTLGAIYLVFQEFIAVLGETEEEKEEDISHEVDEKDKSQR